MLGLGRDSAEYTVWDGRTLIAAGVRWPYVASVTGCDGAVRERVDASPLALVWAGYTIQREES